MRRSIRIALAILVLLLVSWGMWRVLRSEPTYEGRPLASWLQQHADAAYTGDQRAREEAEIAIQHIGTNALPTLWLWITKRDSSAKKFLLANWPFGERALIQLGVHPAGEYHAKTTYACGVLKAAARPLVPGLILLLKDSDPDIRSSAAFALGRIGPAAEAAVPALMASLADSAAQNNALAALRAIDVKPEILVRVLGEFLSSTNLGQQLWAMANLAAYGTNARSAAPKILELIHDPRWYLGNAASNCIKEIDPAGLRGDSRGRD